MTKSFQPRMTIFCLVITSVFCLRMMHQWHERGKKEAREEVIVQASNTDLHDLWRNIFFIQN